MTSTTDSNILDQLADWFGRFVRTSNPEDLWLLALWVGHTHVLDQVRTTPRLLISSPMPGAGKTTTLEHVQALSGGKPVMAANALTPAVVARVAALGRPLLIDEADKHIGTGNAEQKALLGIVNAGYKRGGSYLVNEQNPDGSWTPVDLDVFAPVAMAGLPTNLPDDTMSRALQVWLLPDTDGTAEETDWEAIEGEAEHLRGACEAYAAEVELAGSETLPDGITGRLKETWRPLKRLADAVGGEWPERVDELARRHLEGLEADREDGLATERPAVLLVRDLYGVWHLASGADGFAPTRDLIAALTAYSAEVWGDRQPSGRQPLNPQRMGNMLTKGYGIRSERRRFDGEQLRGYWPHQFVGPWTALGLDPDVMALVDLDAA